MMDKKKAEIAGFIGGDRAYIPPNVALEMAGRNDFQRVTIIGLRSDGTEYLFSSSPNAEEAIWDIERAKFRILSGGQDGQE